MQLPRELSERKYVMRRVWFSCYINDHEQGRKCCDSLLGFRDVVGSARIC